MKARISRKHRKQMERELAPVLEAKDKRIAELERGARYAQDRERSIRQETDKEKALLTEYLNRVVRMHLDTVPPYGPGGSRGERYRLVLDIDEYMVRQAFEWGNDTAVIQILGERLGHQAARTILEMNMRRVG